MRALDPEVVDAVWAAVEPLLRRPDRCHPLGCHRPRIADRICFEAMLIRLVTGCSWVDIERLCGRQVSDTTLRARRDEWIAAGVFDALITEALAAYDRIIGLDLSRRGHRRVPHKAPCGGDGTGKNPTDRGKLGWKWSIATDTAGIVVGWELAPANRNDIVSLEPTLTSIAARGLTPDIETLHLDKGIRRPPHPPPGSPPSASTAQSSVAAATRPAKAASTVPAQPPVDGGTHQLLALQPPVNSAATPTAAAGCRRRACA